MESLHRRTGAGNPGLVRAHVARLHQQLADEVAGRRPRTIPFGHLWRDTPAGQRVIAQTLAGAEILPERMRA